MPFVDMKDASSEDESVEYKEPLYPWGLKLYFEEKALEKLGTTADDYKIGEEFPMTVKVRVYGISAREIEGGESKECVDMQVVAVEKPSPREEGRAKRMFSSMGGDDE